MATKSMAYDNPAYLSVNSMGQSLTGASAKVQFAAFTAMLVKSVTIKPTVAGTSNDAFTILQYLANGTGTTTTVLTTYGSGVATGTNIVTTLTLAQGDACQVAKGADATGVYGVTFETVIVPGSTVTQ